MDRMNWSRIVASLVALGAVILGHSSARAATVTYTDSTSFLAAVPAGAFTADFATLNTSGGVAPIPESVAPATVAVSGGTPTVNYTLANGTAGSSLWTDKFFNPTLLTTTNGGQSVIVDFISGNVFAAGGGFVVTNSSGERQAGVPINLTYYDGPGGTGNVVATASVESTAGSELNPLPFLGLTSTAALGSLVITPSAQFIGVNNFTVAVPEPSAVALLGGAVTCCAGWLVRRTRRRTI